MRLPAIMTARRIALAVVAAALTAAACSAIDPNPPDPHSHPDPLVGSSLDAGDAEAAP